MEGKLLALLGDTRKTQQPLLSYMESIYEASNDTAKYLKHIGDMHAVQQYSLNALLHPSSEDRFKESFKAFCKANTDLSWEISFLAKSSPSTDLYANMNLAQTVIQLPWARLIAFAESSGIAEAERDGAEMALKTIIVERPIAHPQPPEECYALLRKILETGQRSEEEKQTIISFFA